MTDLYQLIETRYPTLKPYGGLDIPPGWYSIVLNLLEELMQTGYDLKGVAQIKEKFGGLRFYAYDLTEEQQAMISRTEALSYEVCAVCGSQEKVKTLTTPSGHYIDTLCNDCVLNEISQIKREMI